MGMRSLPPPHVAIKGVLRFFLRCNVAAPCSCSFCHANASTRRDFYARRIIAKVNQHTLVCAIRVCQRGNVAQLDGDPPLVEKVGHVSANVGVDWRGNDTNGRGCVGATLVALMIHVARTQHAVARKMVKGKRTRSHHTTFVANGTTCLAVVKLCVGVASAGKHCVARAGAGDNVEHSLGHLDAVRLVKAIMTEAARRTLGAKAPSLARLVLDVQQVVAVDVGGTTRSAFCLQTTLPSNALGHGRGIAVVVALGGKHGCAVVKESA